jgi:uncharacterized protein YgiM (DUF1202 family)
MKRVAILLLLLTACAKHEAVALTDTREPIEVSYVTAPGMRVHAKPDDASAVTSNYENGEAVSVLAKQGEWVEIRTGDASGWAHAADLGSGAEAKEQAENPTPRFQKFASPVANPGVHGEIYFEADVNTEGEVVAVRTISNTTGSDALASQNAAALKAAKFYPIVHKGKRMPFKYYHKVGY